MANWTHKIELKDLHDKYKAGELTPPELGMEAAKRIRALLALNTPPISDELKDTAEEIALSFETDIEDIDDYDNVLDELYDWADTELPHTANIPFSATPKLCWVNTF